jgi:asparagine synthase (glutamine-hydrolysing)
MCGICGKVMFDPNATVPRVDVTNMAAAIEHRGPDDEGYHFAGPVGLGFRRLSIIDLNTGHQPISNEDGSVIVVFNGEIYNYQDLRRELRAKGHMFKTQTDTEVLVHLYEEHGEQMLGRLRGMFGFAIWDQRNRKLLLARDRVGIKPLYYHLGKTSLSFGSEIKAVLAGSDCITDIYPEMIDRFLTFFYMPGTETLFKDIHKLAPGTYLVFEKGLAKVRQYWDLHFTETVTKNEDEVSAQLLSLLEETVASHMISDVPVGFLLSGGVDSTAMLSLAAGKTTQETSSYTVGFAAPDIVDERPYARIAARRFGTEHHELEISAKQFRDFLPGYVWHMEEPVCEPPAVALYYISKLASKYVKVLISGEGGDEAFAGYSNYRNLLWLERIKRLFGNRQGLLAAGVSGLNGALRSKTIAKYQRLVGVPLADYYYSRTSTPYHFFNKHACDLYSSEFMQQVDKSRSLRGLPTYPSANGHLGTLESMLYVDTKTWLPDDLLIKADKMTMANSVELRVPFLDHRVLEFAAGIPADYKVKWGTTKYIAKKALKNCVPEEIINRPKAGFPVPYERWLRTDLRDFVRSVLLDRETMNRGYFNRTALAKLIDDDSKHGGYSKELFSLVVLELWHREFLRPIPSKSPVSSHSLAVIQ